MPSKIFISHAGSDSPQAMKIAEVLSSVGISVMIDREEIMPGSSIIGFMESALAECDYCLLLWSEAASKRPWVQAEWEAAFYRTIQRSQTFLIIGRLDRYPLPLLLAPRRAVDLFPTLHPGIDELIQIWRDDYTVTNISGRPVGPAGIPIQEDRTGETIYITSDLFALTMPLRLDLSIPSGIHLDRLVSGLKLPRQFDYEGRLGVRLEYRFAYAGEPVVRSKSLSEQGLRTGEILWLEVEMKPFASISPLKGNLEPATFRGDEETQWTQAKKAARTKLLSSISNAGLGV